MSIIELDANTVDALHQRGHDDDAIEKMTADEVFDQFCLCHGLIGWGPTLRRVKDNAEAAFKSNA